MANKEVKYVLQRDTRDFRVIGAEMEVLGQRLDAARSAFDASKADSWAQKHWQSVIDRLMMRWRQLPHLHDGQAVCTDRPRWQIQMDWFERDDGIGHNTFVDRLYSHYFTQPDLTSSWERARNARITNLP